GRALLHGDRIGDASLRIGRGEGETLAAELHRRTHIAEGDAEFEVVLGACRVLYACVERKAKCRHIRDRLRHAPQQKADGYFSVKRMAVGNSKVEEARAVIGSRAFGRPGSGDGDI